MSDRATVRTAKLDRLRGGAAPRVLELCSGAGGLSLGLASSGFAHVAHVESDTVAADSFAMNFRPPTGVDPQAWAKPRNMEEIGAEDLVRELGLAGDTTNAFDVLAAGLPCQAFARIGRSKLRSIRGEEDAFRSDPRAKLYQRFLDYVDTVQPVAVLLENVPDILNFGGHNVPEEICETLEKRGYLTAYTLLNAAHYGVPQMRERLFLIAVDASLGIRPGFPAQTHRAELPAGYKGVRTVALKHVPGDGRFTTVPAAGESLPAAIAVRDALSDLPSIREHCTDPAAMRRRKLTDALPYRSIVDLTPYQRIMRERPGFRAGGVVTGNVVRLTPRDFPIFGAMPRGADYPQALAIAEQLFESRLAAEPAPAAEGSQRWAEIRRSVVPPYDPDKFPNKWWKLDPALPSRTLTAHMGKDTYSHIHWDARQQRTISVREAARLQSFPDAFRFAGAMNAAYRQIGNAVPPLLARAVAARLKADLLREPVRMTCEELAA